MTKKAAGNLFRGFDDKAGPSAALAPAPEPTPAAASDTASRQRSRQGKKVVTYYLDPEPFTQLKILSAKTGTTIQDLSLEALNLLFERHQLSRIAR
ncbi:MAG: hypothetical protein JO312_16165 [Hyphomicrobiales bacterium]|nr:hypothetical protein [Hyphomicrobiales bacterium]